MNDNNKSSQDVEFDFNNPKATETIVDPTMIRSPGGASPKMMKIAAAGAFALLSLGYILFSGSSKRPEAPKSTPPILQLAQQEQTDINTPVDPNEAMPTDQIEEELAPFAQEAPDPAPAADPSKSSATVSMPSQQVLEHPKAVDPAHAPAMEAPVPTAVAPDPKVMAPEKPALEEKPVAPEDKSVSVTTSAPVASSTATASSASSSQDYGVLSQKIDKVNQDLISLLNSHAEKSDSSDKNLSEGFRKYAAATLQRLDQLAKDQALIAQSIKALSETLQNNNDQIGRIDKFIQAEISQFAETAAGLTLAMPAPKYVVHAIIPGRAWLRDPQQKILSVTEGQELEGYGKVLTIDPRLGTVILSSGQVLRY